MRSLRTGSRFFATWSSSPITSQTPLVRQYPSSRKFHVQDMKRHSLTAHDGIETEDESTWTL